MNLFQTFGRACLGICCALDRIHDVLIVVGNEDNGDGGGRPLTRKHLLKLTHTLPEELVVGRARMAGSD
jgi:hypothetical protein